MNRDLKFLPAINKDRVRARAYERWPYEPQKLYFMVAELEE